METPADFSGKATGFGVPTWAIALVGIALLALAPLAVYPVLLMNMMCFALFAAAFNLLIGYVGLLSFGHAAFFGTGAYICAYTAQSWGLTPELAILLGAVASAVLGAAMGFIAIRRKGIYFSMITLALARMVQFAAQQLPFTQGEDGLHGIPQGKLFGLFSLASQTAIYVFTAVVFVGGLLVLWRIVHSPFGSILKGIRENEARSISLGYDVERYKLAAFTMSATIAGVAGALKAIAIQDVGLGDISWQMSGDVILMTLLGGIGTFIGPILGGAFVIGLQLHGEATLANLKTAIGRLEPLLGARVTEFLEWPALIPIPVLIGAIFIACVLLFRRGVIGEIEAMVRRKTVARAANP